MKYYVVIDTNVVVSAMIKWNSVPGNILQYVFKGRIIPVLNPQIIKEYRTVLMRPKFHLTEDIVIRVLDSLAENGIYVNAETLDIELPDPKDLIFYEVVMEVRKDKDAYLVTGNIKHFPNEHYIVTPREMLNILQSSEG